MSAGEWPKNASVLKLELTGSADMNRTAHVTTICVGLLLLLIFANAGAQGADPATSDPQQVQAQAEAQTKAQEAARLEAQSEARADAVVQNFKLYERVPDEYIVAFKSPAALRELQRLPELSARRPTIQPQVMPISKFDCRVLAGEFAKKLGASVIAFFPGQKERSCAFGIKGVSEENIKGIIAIDPRVKYIEANGVYRFQAGLP